MLMKDYFIYYEVPGNGISNTNFHFTQTLHIHYTGHFITRHNIQHLHSNGHPFLDVS